MKSKITTKTARLRGIAAELARQLAALNAEIERLEGGKAEARAPAKRSPKKTAKRRAAKVARKVTKKAARKVAKKAKVSASKASAWASR